MVQYDGQILAEIFGAQHNVVGFDPRGVGESGPVIDCWPNHPERRAQFEKLFYPDVSNASSTSLDIQFYTAKIFGSACTSSVGGENRNASFISTPAVAHDMLTYINAEQSAAGRSLNNSKISYYGLSYGSVLGVTFASLYPDHVGRMILDGVFEASDYNDLGWSTNVYDSDKALDSFCRYCYQGGSKNCSFWGPSEENISSRLNELVNSLKYHPIPIPSSEACEIPLTATYADLKEYILQAMYFPLTNFPQLADVLSGLEQGNFSAYVAAVTSSTLPADPCNNGTSGSTTDISTLIKCIDGYAGHKFQNVHQYQDYVGMLTLDSPFFGEVWPNNANTVSCRAFNGTPPESARLTGMAVLAFNTLRFYLTGTRFYHGSQKHLISDHVCHGRD